MTSIKWFLDQSEEQVRLAETVEWTGGSEEYDYRLRLLCACALWSVVQMAVQNDIDLEPEQERQFTYLKLKFAQHANWLPDEARP